MVTININIEADGKAISSSVHETSNLHSQEVVPSPLTILSANNVESDIPTPEKMGEVAYSYQSSLAIPSPLDFETSGVSIEDQVPTPINELGQGNTSDTKIPVPMDFDNLGSASPTTKPKSRATKRKSGTK